jgi:TetR/AcrR family transcriptional regulator
LDKKVRTSAIVARRERRDPEATRQALLRAGGELFSERGYDGVSTEDLAGRAGVNKALISYHFRGKRGLYVAILESAFAAMSARLQSIERNGPDARHVLGAILSAFQQVTRERPGFPTLFMREVLSTGIEPAVVPHLASIVDVSRRLAERGVREGLFRPIDPLLLHFGLVGPLVFFFATEPARRQAASAGHLPFALPDAGRFLRHIENLTLRGLAPEVPSRRTPGPGAARRSSRPRRKGARA